MRKLFRNHLCVMLLTVLALLSACSASPDPGASGTPIPAAPEPQPELVGLEELDQTNAAGDIAFAAKLSADAVYDGQYLTSLQLFGSSEGQVAALYALSDSAPSHEAGDLSGIPGAYYLQPLDGSDEPAALGDGWMDAVGDLLWYRSADGQDMHAAAYDFSGAAVETFSLQTEESGYFSPDGTDYYEPCDGAIRRIPLDDPDQSSFIPLDRPFCVTSLSGLFTSDSGHTCAAVSGLNGDLKQCQAVVDLDTGTFLYLAPDTYDSSYLYTISTAAVRSSFSDVQEYAVYSGDTLLEFLWQNPDLALSLYCLNDGSLLFSYTAPSEDGLRCTIALGLYDIRTGTLKAASSVELEGSFGFLRDTPIVLEDGRILLSLQNETTDSWFCRWTPEQDGGEMDELSVTVTPDPEPYLVEADQNWTAEDITPGPCPEDLLPLRQRADALEERFGVQIYLSEECRSLIGGYLVAPLSDYDTVSGALDCLETELSRYPDGFFAQFDLSGSETWSWLEGIDIHLAGTLTGMEDSALDFAGGFQTTNTNRIVLVLDCTWPSVIDWSLHHELCHAIETKILADTGAGCDSPEWDALNPPGFQYAYSYSAYGDPEWYPYIYTSNTAGDAYFIDDYSTSYSIEDRARLFEYAMVNDGFVDWTAAPHLQAKLNAFAAFIRENFDSTGWDDVPWERFASP